MSKKQEVTKSDAGVPVAAMDMGAWGQSQVSSQDIIIPKVLIMQGLSDLVTDGKAKMGDFVDSLSSEVLGSIDKPLEFVPFHMEKIYIISKRKSGSNDRHEFDRIEAVANQNYPMDEVVGEMEYKYEYCLQFYSLLTHDTSLPYILSFKSTALRAGKAVATQMYARNVAAGKVPPAMTMQLGGRKEKNDKGTFIVPEVKVTGETPSELVAEAFNWYKTIEAGKTKADEANY